MEIFEFYYVLLMSRVMRKPFFFCICENKAADQLFGNRPVCVGPGLKPRKPVFSRRGLFVLVHARGWHDFFNVAWQTVDV